MTIKLLFFFSLTISSGMLFGMRHDGAPLAPGPNQQVPRPDQRNTPIERLWQACNKGDEAAVRHLINIEKVDPNIRLFLEDGHDRSTCLHYAASGGHINIVRELLTYGVEINPRDPNGWTPLIPALAGGYEDVVDILILKGANVNNVDSLYKLTPLATPIQCLNPSLIIRLLKAGAAVNEYFDRRGLEGFGFRIPIIEVIPLHTLFESLKNKPGYAPTYPVQETEDRALEIIEILRRAGARLDAQDADKDTPFHLVAATNNQRFACALLVDLPAQEGDKLVNDYVLLHRKKSALNTLRSFLLVNNRHIGNAHNNIPDLPPLPEEVIRKIFAHLPIECTYGQVEALVAPHIIDRATLRRRFLDATWPHIQRFSWNRHQDMKLLIAFNIQNREGHAAYELTKNKAMAHN